MKKCGFIIFLCALTIGTIFSANCSFVSFNSLSGIKGSGTAKSEIRNVSGFKGIQAGGAVNLEVAVQKDFSVEIQADDNLLEHIKTETSGDTLKIYSDERMSPKTKISVRISMPEITSLDVSGASNAIVTSVKADSLKLEASGASEIKLDGEARALESEASGASSIEAEALRVENADVEVSGASDTTVSAINELKADASGASTIYYTGEPKNIKENSSGASSIKRK